jgi:NADH dehydrogenase
MTPRPHQVFIAGATGYTGRVLAPLIAKSVDWRPVAHVRPGSSHADSLPAEIERREVDLADTAALVSALAGCEALVSLIGTTRAQFGPGVSYETVDVGTTRWLVAAARRARVRRFVLLSSKRIADDYRPVHVEVLARALFAAVQQPQTAGEIWSGKTIWGK